MLKCIMPFIQAEIHTDGSVYTCCTDAIKNYSIGNVFEQSFEDIWNSEKAAEIRKKILNGDYSCCDLKRCIPVDSYEHIVWSKKLYEDFVNSEKNDFPKIIKCSYDLECNVACTTCRDAIIRHSDSDLAKVDDLIDSIILPSLKNADIIYLNGAGDPFTSRHSVKLIKAVSENYPNIKFVLHTNGTLLLKDMFEKMDLEGKITTISISMHASRKSTYDRIVKYGNFDTVIKNLEYLSGLIQSRKIPTYSLCFVVQSENYKDMPEFAELAKKYNANAVFWEYRDWKTSMSKEYDKYAVFTPSHSENSEFLNLLQDERLKQKNVFMNPLLEELRDSK